MCGINGYVKIGPIEGLRVLMVFAQENENLDYTAFHQGYTPNTFL